MIQGWSAQMKGGRGLKQSSVAGTVGRVRAFQEFCGEWPWRWSAAMFDEWMVELVSRGLVLSTRRGYQQAIRSFCSYLCSPHYGWITECEERFGEHPVQVSHEENTLRHLTDLEGSPARRPLTRRELQTLLDRVDREVDLRLEQKRKGAAIAYRDATRPNAVLASTVRFVSACRNLQGSSCKPLAEGSESELGGTMTSQNPPSSDTPLSTEIIVRGIVRRYNEILLVRQANADWWFLPGGHLERAENLTECLSRELMEEAQLRVGEVSGLGLLEHSYTDESGLHHEINVVLETVPLNDVGTVEEHLTFHWFTLEEIETLDLRPRGIAAIIDHTGPQLRLLPQSVEDHG